MSCHIMMCEIRHQALSGLFRPVLIFLKDITCIFMSLYRDMSIICTFLNCISEVT